MGLSELTDECIFQTSLILYSFLLHLARPDLQTCLIRLLINIYKGSSLFIHITLTCELLLFCDKDKVALFHHAQILPALAHVFTKRISAHARLLPVLALAIVHQPSLAHKLINLIEVIQTLLVELVADHTFARRDHHLAADESSPILAQLALAAHDHGIVDPLPSAWRKVLAKERSVGQIKHGNPTGLEDAADLFQQVRVGVIAGKVSK